MRCLEGSFQGDKDNWDASCYTSYSPILGIPRAIKQRAPKQKYFPNIYVRILDNITSAKATHKASKDTRDGKVGLIMGGKKCMGIFVNCHTSNQSLGSYLYPIL